MNPRLAISLAALLVLTRSASAQPALPSAPPAAQDPTAKEAGSLVATVTGEAPPEIKELRDGLIDAFNKRDVDRLLSYLHPNVVVTWQNGEVSHGREEVRAYYDKMLVGPDAIVKDLGVQPTIEGRKVFGDTSISYGKMNDWFKLKDGLEVRLDSRFSAHLTKGADGKWLVSGFHASANAFDNAVTHVVAKKVGTYAGVGGGIGGLLIGGIVGLIIGKRRSPATAEARS